MRALGIWAGAAALSLAIGAGPGALAQDAPIPRAVGYAKLAQLPDWSGVWGPDRRALGTTVGPPARPQLTPAAQAIVEAFRAKQEKEGVSQFAQAHCIPPGMPGIMNQPYPIAIGFEPDKVTIFVEAYSQQRRIYTDGRPLPEDPDLLFNGTSVGHWDGDTLEVDTIGLSPLASSITMGLPSTEKTRIHEKIWLQSPDVLRIETTITDPDMLAAPYVSQAAYSRKKDWEIREYECAENNRLVSGEEGAANIDLGLDEGDDADPFAGTDD